MKAQVLQENFAKVLSTTSRFVSPKAQLPILGNVLLKTSNTRLHVMATNLEVSIATSIGAKVEEEGMITVSAKTLTDLVTNLEKGPVEISSKEEDLLLSNSRFNGKLGGMNAVDFPSIPQTIGEQKITLNTLEFKKALSEVTFAVSSDETRPILTGVLFSLSGDLLTLVATDGFRLSHKQIKLSEPIKDELKVIVPRLALSEVPKISVDSTTLSMEILPKESQILFATENTILSSRVIEGEFPPFQRIIPKELHTKVSMDKHDLHSAIKLASVISRDNGYLGKITIGEGQVIVSAENTSSGNQKTTIDAKVMGEGMDVLFNVRFVEEFLNSVEGDEIELGVNDINSPGVFRDLTDPSFFHLVMPVKI